MPKAGFNTGTAYSELFNVVDPVVLQPKREELQGRTMFQLNRFPIHGHLLTNGHGKKLWAKHQTTPTVQQTSLPLM